jgi:hypothetical protein
MRKNDPGTGMEQPDADVAKKSAHPGERYANAKPGTHGNDTLGPKGYQPPGGPVKGMHNQQLTKAELDRATPKPKPE